MNSSTNSSIITNEITAHIHITNTNTNTNATIFVVSSAWMYEEWINRCIHVILTIALAYQCTFDLCHQTSPTPTPVLAASAHSMQTGKMPMHARRFGLLGSIFGVTIPLVNICPGLFACLLVCLFAC